LSKSDALGIAKRNAKDGVTKIWADNDRRNNSTRKTWMRKQDGSIT